jgi:hypothetical protein
MSETVKQNLDSAYNSFFFEVFSMQFGFQRSLLRFTAVGTAV